MVYLQIYKNVYFFCSFVCVALYAAEKKQASLRFAPRFTNEPKNVFGAKYVANSQASKYVYNKFYIDIIFFCASSATHFCIRQLGSASALH